MERAYRYCRALEDRPDSPADWERRPEDPRPGRRPGPDSGLRTDQGLGCSPGSPGRPTPVPRPGPRRTAPPWLDEHLLGFVAECEAAGPDSSPDPDRRRKAGPRPGSRGAPRGRTGVAALHGFAGPPPRFLLGALSRGGHLLRPGSDRRGRRPPGAMPGSPSRQCRPPGPARRLPVRPSQSLIRGHPALRPGAGGGARPCRVLSDPSLPPAETRADRAASPTTCDPSRCGGTSCPILLGRHRSPETGRVRRTPAAGRLPRRAGPRAQARATRPEWPWTSTRRSSTSARGSPARSRGRRVRGRPGRDR